MQDRCSISIVALIGLPAAGKTSFSNSLLSDPQKNFNIIHLCYDDFLQFTTTTSSEEIDFKVQRLKIFNILKSIVQSLRATEDIQRIIEKNNIKISLSSSKTQNFVVICDDNHYYRSMRYKLYQFCRDNSLAFAQIYLASNLEQALARNEQRLSNAKISKNIIEQMALRLEPPDAIKYPWETQTLMLECANLRNVINENVLLFLFQTFEYILLPIQIKPKEAQFTSIVHQLDLLLRQRIKELISISSSTSTAAEKRTRANNLNEKRLEILQDFKENRYEEQLLAKYVELLY